MANAAYKSIEKFVSCNLFVQLNKPDESIGQAQEMLRQAAKLEKGSPEPHKEKVGSVTRDQVRHIAETKMVDLNANDIGAAMKIVEGTARSMGITVDG